MLLRGILGVWTMAHIEGSGLRVRGIRKYKDPLKSHERGSSSLKWLQAAGCVYAYVCTYVYIHTYIHTYIRTYIRRYVHTYINIDMTSRLQSRGDQAFFFRVELRFIVNLQGYKYVYQVSLTLNLRFRWRVYRVADLWRACCHFAFRQLLVRKLEASQHKRRLFFGVQCL